MVDVLTIPVAIVLGFLAGLGVGGGSLLMLWLVVITGMDHPQARIINLLFFLPSALIATLFHKKQGRVKLRKLVPAILWGCISAGVFSYIGKQTDTTMLKKCFGGLLLITGVRELFYRPRKAK